MKPEKYQIISELAVEHERKKAVFEALGARNTYGMTPEQREKSATEYAIAEAEMVAAGSRLRGAISSAQ